MTPYRPDATGVRSHVDEGILRRMGETLDLGRLREPTRVRLTAALAIARRIVTR